MIRSRRLAVVLVALCAVVLSGCGKKPAPAPPEEGNYYVGLGDSFTAVAGTGPFSNEVCNRSAEDYPALVAAKMKFTSFADVSCGGAQSLNLTQAQGISGVGVNQAQLDAVSAETKLVTLGIGLNDAPGTTTDGNQISFLLLYTCQPDDEGKRPPSCPSYLQQPDSGFDSVIAGMADDVRAAIGQIRQQAPDARIVLVGYPRVAPDAGECPKQIPLPPVAVNRLRFVIHDADQALKQVAKKEKADYIDMWTASKGHDACSADPWVNGWKERAGKALPYHPYKAYHRAVADKIVALLKQKPQA